MCLYHGNQSVAIKRSTFGSSTLPPQPPSDLPFQFFLFNGVPGLGGPITFSVVGRRPVENNRFLNE